MSCCTNTYDLGCLGHCDIVTLPDTVGIDEAGTWTFQVKKPDNAVVSITADLNEGDDIAFVIADILSPNTSFTFSVLDAAGEPYSYVAYDGTSYDCFAFSTVYNVTV